MAVVKLAIIYFIIKQIVLTALSYKVLRVARAIAGFFYYLSSCSAIWGIALA